MMRPNFAGADEKKNDFQRTYEQIDECVNLGVHENFINGVKIAEPMKGNSSKSGDVLISLKKYMIHWTRLSPQSASPTCSQNLPRRTMTTRSPTNRLSST